MENLAKKARNVTGLSQEKFAQAYRIPLSTLRKHEQLVNVPRGALRPYYQLIAAHPEDVKNKLAILPK